MESWRRLQAVVHWLQAVAMFRSAGLGNDMYVSFRIVLLAWKYKSAIAKLTAYEILFRAFRLRDCRRAARAMRAAQIQECNWARALRAGSKSGLRERAVRRHSTAFSLPPVCMKTSAML